MRRICSGFYPATTGAGDSIRARQTRRSDSGGPGSVDPARVEAFHVLNRSNFNPPNGNRSATAFGTITQIATGTTPRQVQLGVKVYF
jgi:hypothetical protein